MLPLNDAGCCETIEHLYARGYDNDFTLYGDQLFFTGSMFFLTRSEYRIVEMHYIPYEDGAVSEKMIYAICIPGHCIKGILSVTGLQENILFLDARNRTNASTESYYIARLLADVECY